MDILFWIFPNLEGQRNPKWPAKLKHPIDSYLRASVKTVRVVGEKYGSWFKCSARLGYYTNPRKATSRELVIAKFQKYPTTQMYLTTQQWLRESTNEASAACLTLRRRGHVIPL